MNKHTKHIARQRIQTLFTLARQIYKQDPPLAQRYIDTARKIAMAAKTPLPREYRHQICRHCKSFILPGINCHIRTKQHREPHITITCLNCNKQTRIPLRIKERKPNR